MSEPLSVPPPPPGKKPAPPPPPPGKGAPAPAMPPTATAPGARPMPGMPGAMPGMPGAGFPGAAPADPRAQEMEKRFQEAEAARKAMESQLGELQGELRQEREKLLVQALKSKEEETLSVRVEQQMREIQERLRREKYEQEIQDSRGKAEIQLKDIERRLSQERETWMLALKSQLKERETVEREAEQNMARRMHDLEHRYEEEKVRWGHMLRQKEDEMHQVRRDVQVDLDRLRQTIEDKDEQLEESRRSGEQQKRVVELQAQTEIRDLQNKLDAHMREAGAWKAQIALLQNQVQQLEMLKQEERTRLEHQRTQLEKEHQDAVRRAEAQAQLRIETEQRDAARRDMERTQQTEGLFAQLRLEKDSLRQLLIRKEEDLGEAQQTIAGYKRELDTEKSRWSVEIDQIRRGAIEDAERRLPDIYSQKLARERQEWEQQHQAVIDTLKGQIAQLSETEQAMRAQMQVDAQRAGQELAQWSERALQSEAHSDNLEKTLAGLREELELVQMTLQEDQSRLISERAQTQAQIKMFQSQIAQLHEEYNRLQAQESEAHQQSGALQDTLSAKETQLQEIMDRHAQAQHEQDALRQRVATMEEQIQQESSERKRVEQSKAEGEKREVEWSTAYEQMKEACTSLRAELGQAQSQASARETEWQVQIQDYAQLRTQWEKDKSYLETSLQTAMEKISTLEKAVAQASTQAASAPKLDARAAQSLNTIRQQMKELGATLTWMRSSIRPAKAA